MVQEMALQGSGIFTDLRGNIFWLTSANDFLGKVMVFNKAKHKNSMYNHNYTCLFVFHCSTFSFTYILFCVHIVINCSRFRLKCKLKFFSDSKDFNTVTLYFIFCLYFQLLVSVRR